MQDVEFLEMMKDSVEKLLVSDYDFTLEEAEETVNESFAADTNEVIWHENADPKDLAKYLASDEYDD